MKIVIDTNIWISFIIGKSLINLKDFIINKKIDFITSKEQIEELIEVLHREKFKKYFNEKDIEELLLFISKFSLVVDIENNINDCRDKKDNFILETAIKGSVDIIITGDKDLLDLDPYKNIKIIKYTDFNIILNKYIKI